MGGCRRRCRRQFLIVSVCLSVNSRDRLDITTIIALLQSQLEAIDGNETQLTTAFSLITEEYRSDSEEEGEVDFEETRKSRY